MKKGLLMLLAGFLALSASVSAFASARLDSMAADARQVGDIDLIWLYPNMVVDYKNTVDFRLSTDVFGDFGNDTNEWGGALVEVDPDFGVLGIYVNRPNDLDTVNYGLTNHGGIRPLFRFSQSRVGNVPWFQNDSTYQNQVDLFWGKSLSSGGDLGFHFNYGSGNDDTQVYSLAAGAGLGNVGPFGDLNVHAEYDMESFNYGGGDTSDGIYTAKLGAMATNALSANNDLRLYADLQLDGYGEKTAVDNTYSDFAAVIGAAINQKVDGGKGLFSTGLSLNYINGTSPVADDDFSVDEWDIIWNASIEAPVSDWLTLRAGLSKDIFARIYDRNGSVYGDGNYFNNAGNNVQFSTGVGINWQNFTLDASVDAASLENSINNVQPGNGIFFNNGNNILTVESADLKYKF